MFSFARNRTLRFLFSLFLLALLIRPAHADVTYQTTSDWGSGFNGQITITNPNGPALTSWTLAFDFAPSITLIWDATIVSHVGQHYVIQSAGWNDSLPVGGQVSFGFGGAPGNITAGPRNMTLSGISVVAPVPTTPPPPSTPTPSPSSGAVTVTITETSAWSSGFGANLVITNGTSQTINGWTLSFAFTPTIDDLWNGDITSHQGSVYTVQNASWDGTLAPGGTASVGLTGSGTLTPSSASQAVFNGTPCTITTAVGGSDNPPSSPGLPGIVIGGADGDTVALEITAPWGASTFPLSLSNGAAPSFSVTNNNASVVSASVTPDQKLNLTGLAAGRAALKLRDANTGTVRYVGVRVKNADGSLPGFPKYVALGSVSEDTDDDLNFWEAFGPGPENKRVDARYIYLNGGPYYGWTTWTNTPGDRTATYIQNSQKLGMIPYFVFYNIPDGGESFYTDLQHVQDPTYMGDYYKNLLLALTIINQDSPDDPVGIILEPDFLGYLAQNVGMPASTISAATHAVYDSGVLTRGVDPNFPDTVQGVVKSINYLISRRSPQVRFGWQMNLWASPAGGWTTPIPGKGIVHLTDSLGIVRGRSAITNEAKAITHYYLDAGVASYGAQFLSVDKYGLDAASAEASAASDPADSTWFWNNDLWGNYLTFVRAMHDASGLPITLWQLPVGHINRSTEPDPYNNLALFPDLPNANRQSEDSAPTFFFGDSFITTGPRWTYFSTNAGGDPKLATNGNTITWGEHMSDAAAAGATVVLFGAGVGASTTNVGSPPTDSYWWITRAQEYFQHPVPLGAGD